MERRATSNSRDSPRCPSKLRRRAGSDRFRPHLALEPANIPASARVRSRKSYRHICKTMRVGAAQHTIVCVCLPILAPGGIMRTTSLILIFNICLLPIYAGDLDNSFIAALKNLQPIASTVPGNGDVNPYGVAIVPRTTGSLVQNSILVSNFNNAQNLQGTGTTIDQISPNGDVKVFAQISAASVPDCTGGVG